MSGLFGFRIGMLLVLLSLSFSSPAGSMNHYQFQQPGNWGAILQNLNQRGVAVDEVDVLRQRVEIITAGEKELVGVPGDGNCMIHAFCRSAQIGDTVIVARQNAANWMRANPGAFVQGCNSFLNELIDLGPFNGDWNVYCDSLAQPAQGAGDVAHYGDVGLLVGLSGHYELSIACITAVNGDHWLLIFNATDLEYCTTVYIAREGIQQEHYWATRQARLTDQDQYLLETVASNMPISLTLNSALNCADKECDMAVRTLSVLDTFETKLHELKSRREAASGGGYAEDDPMFSQVEDWLLAIAMCRRTVQGASQEVAAAFAETGQGKSFMIDTLQYITAPTKEAYHKAGRRREKEAAHDHLVLNVLVSVKEVLRHRKPSYKDLSRLLQTLHLAASTYFAAYANPALQEYLPHYLDPAVLDDLNDITLPSDEEAFDDMEREARLKELEEVVGRLQAAMVDPSTQPPAGFEIRPLSADPYAASAAWDELIRKFSNLLSHDRLGNATTYLLRVKHQQGSTTLTNLSIEYAETFMLVEKLIGREELLTQLMEIAEFMHPCSELYNTPEAVEFRAKDDEMKGLRKHMYEKLTLLRLPATAEEARATETGHDSQSGSASSLPLQPMRTGRGALINRNVARLMQCATPQGSPVMPRSAQDIPLNEDTEAILRGPPTIIHRGSNRCLMQDRLAVRELLHAHDNLNDVRRFLITESRLYSPSTTNKKLKTLDVPGFGVTDPGERYQTLKALDQASTLLFPTFKNLSSNTKALELLGLSRFMTQGRARVAAAASPPAINTQGQAQGHGTTADVKSDAEAQATQAEEEEQEEEQQQQLVLMSYPENNGQNLTSVQDVLSELRAREYFDGLEAGRFTEASEQALLNALLQPTGTSNLLLRQAAAEHLDANFKCLQFLPSLAAAIACATHEDMERLRQSCPPGVNFAARLNRLLCEAGLSATLALPEYLQAKRLVPAIRKLIDTLASSQPLDTPSLVLEQRSGAVENVLENVEKFFKSLYVPQSKQRSLLLQQVERTWYDAHWNRTILEAKRKMRVRLESERRAMENMVRTGTSAAVEDLRRRLSSSTIQRSFFRTSSTRVDDVDIADIIFGDLDILRIDGEVVETFVRAPLRLLIKELCESYKSHLQEALNKAGLKDERCAGLVLRIDAARKQAEQDLGAWVLNKGTLKTLLTRRRSRRGADKQVLNAQEARAAAFSNYRARLRGQQMAPGHAAFLDLICDEEAVQECRAEAVELLFGIFLDRVGLRQGNLLDTLVMELEERAVGVKSNRSIILYRHFRSAIRDIHRANRQESEEDVKREHEEENVARRLVEVGAGMQGRLEGVLVDIKSLLTGTRTHPIPPSAQQHLAGQVLSRKLQSLLQDMDAIKLLRKLYSPEQDRAWLKRYHSFHDANGKGATDARQSPFEKEYYGFMEPAPDAQGGAMDVDQKPSGTPAKGSAKKGKGKGGSSKGQRRSPGGKASTSTSGQDRTATTVALPPSDEIFFSLEHLQRLRARMGENELILVEAGHLGVNAAEMMGEGGIIFRHGLMSAATLLLYGFIPPMQSRGKVAPPETPLAGLLQQAWSWRHAGLSDAAMLRDVAGQLTREVCASLLNDTIFADTANAQQHRVALQSLLPVDMLCYLEGLSAQHVGAHPALLHFISDIFHVNIQIWDGVRIEQPPLLLGTQPLNSFTVNLVYFPPPAATDAAPDLRRDNLYRYGRWAVVMRKPLQPVRLKQKRKRTEREKDKDNGSGGSGTEEDWESGQSSGGEGGSGDNKRVRFGRNLGW